MLLSVTLPFIIAMVAYAINELMARRVDYLREEIRVLKEALAASTGKARIDLTAKQRRRLALKGKALTAVFFRIARGESRRRSARGQNRTVAFLSASYCSAREPTWTPQLHPRAVAEPLVIAQGNVVDDVVVRRVFAIGKSKRSQDALDGDSCHVNGQRVALNPLQLARVPHSLERSVPRLRRNREPRLRASRSHCPPVAPRTVTPRSFALRRVTRDPNIPRGF